MDNFRVYSEEEEEDVWFVHTCDDMQYQGRVIVTSFGVETETQTLRIALRCLECSAVGQRKLGSWPKRSPARKTS